MIYVVKRNDPQLKRLSAWEIRSKYRDISDEELIKRIRNKFEKYELEFQKIDQKYQKDFDAQIWRKLKTIGKFFYIGPFLLPYCILLGYLLCRSIKDSKWICFQFFAFIKQFVIKIVFPIIGVRLYTGIQ